jgi:hypothetical protein
MVSQLDLLPEDGLFHYTDIRGLHGILQNKELWATHVTYLNDSQEFRLGMNLINQQVKLTYLNDSLEFRLENLINQQVKLAPQPESSNPITAFSGFVAAHGLIQNFEMLSEKVPEEAGPFVACLSAAGDQLSQWRGYGTGGGYAIHFDANALQQHLRRHAPDVEPVYEGVYALPLLTRELAKVIYYAKEPDRPVEIEAIPLIDEGITVLARKFQAYLDELYQNMLARKLPMPEHPDREMQALLGPGMVDLLNLAARVKHDGFEEENEYRIVTLCPPDFFWPSDIGLIPRVKIDFPPSCVRGVRIGPGQHMATRESSVLAYLHKHKDRYSHVEVSRSEIPFTGV